MQAEKMSSQSAEALRRTVSILQYYFLIVDFLVVHTHIFTGQFFQLFYFFVIDIVIWPGDKGGDLLHM